MAYRQGVSQEVTPGVRSGRKVVKQRQNWVDDEKAEA